MNPEDMNSFCLLAGDVGASDGFLYQSNKNGQCHQLMRIPGPVVTDSSKVSAGSVFVALQGTRTHGAKHVEDAIARGASLVVVGIDARPVLGPVLESLKLKGSRVPIIESERDGVDALGVIASIWRKQHGWKVVGITGSSGKTSTKDILAALIGPHLVTVASHLNHNNEIGVPLTLLSADESVEVVICEMGMRGLGQIEWLASIAKPDVSIITNVGNAHLELLGTETNIMLAKAELISGTKAGGAAIVPVQPSELKRFAEKHGVRALTFAPEGLVADCSVASIEHDANGIAGSLASGGELFHYRLPLHGSHQAVNLAAAWLAARELLSDPVPANELDHINLSGGRGQKMICADGTTIIDDAYNANPESIRAALLELDRCAGKCKIAVLGRMAELGPRSVEMHRELGRWVEENTKIEKLVVVGNGPDEDALVEGWQGPDLSGSRRADPAFRAADASEAIDVIMRQAESGSAVLLKASNSVGLWRIIDDLSESFDARSQIVGSPNK